MSADREVIGTTGSVPTGAPVSALVSTSAPMPVPGSALATSMATAVAHAEATDALCANCGATVTGHFCSNCGQKNEHPVHSLVHFLHEATEDLTHADSRVWRTIGAVLFRPGFLTTEFLAGRRVRYLPPIRLYLVVSLLFFLFLALTPHHEPTPAERAQIAQRAHGREYVVVGEPNIKSPAERHQHALTTCAKTDAKMNAEVGPGLVQSAAKVLVHKGCLSLVEDNGHALSETFMHSLPRALFITLPIMAALMKLLYRRPSRYYVEHLLFLLHNYSFAFLCAAAFVLLGLTIDSDSIMDPLGCVLFFYACYYFFAALRRVYPESRLRTALKFTALSFSYLIVMGTALVATGVYSVLAQ